MSPSSQGIYCTPSIPSPTQAFCIFGTYRGLNHHLLAWPRPSSRNYGNQINAQMKRSKLHLLQESRTGILLKDLVSVVPTTPPRRAAACVFLPVKVVDFPTFPPPFFLFTEVPFEGVFVGQVVDTGHVHHPSFVCLPPPHTHPNGGMPMRQCVSGSCPWKGRREKRRQLL